MRAHGLAKGIIIALVVANSVRLASRGDLFSLAELLTLAALALAFLPELLQRALPHDDPQPGQRSDGSASAV